MNYFLKTPFLFFYLDFTKIFVTAQMSAVVQCEAMESFQRIVHPKQLDMYLPSSHPDVGDFGSFSEQI